MDSQIWDWNSLVFIHTLQEEKLNWNLNFAISSIADLLNLNSAYYIAFWNIQW